MEVIDFLNNLKATVSGHTQDINTKVLRKDKADTTPYPLGVAPAAAMTDALRKGDTIGGFMRPYRKFRSVGSQEKGPTVASGMAAPIVDPLDGGGVYEIGSIRMKTVTAASVATTVTLKSNGVTIYTQTVLLTALPAVGKLVDLLNLGTGLPADVKLPTNLTIACSAGIYDFTIDGIIVPPA